MSDTSFTTTLRLARPVDEVFEAIIDPRAWWSTTIHGDAGRVGAGIAFDSPGHHLWRFRVAEATRPTRVRWHVTDDSSTDFVADRTEWNGTELRFELTPNGDGTELRFTHAGLVPQFECFEACSTGWTGYIQQSLRALITTGHGQPGRY